MGAMINDLKSYVFDQIRTKVYDCNTAIHRRHAGTSRSFVVSGCHKVIYEDLFASGGRVEFKTLDDLRRQFPDIILGRINSRSKDVSIAGPIAVLLKEYASFPKGTLLLQLKDTEKTPNVLCRVGGHRLIQMSCPNG